MVFPSAFFVFSQKIMLSRIFIQNFALIDRLDIALGKGLQVITGETGAGKSIILGALRLILGERADLKVAADTETKSIVEAEFKISENLKPFFEENDLDFEENTIVRREILPSGKSRAFVNDVPVTLDVLKELSARLVDIHSQFETSNLFSEAYQFSIIDGLGGNQPLVLEYQTKFSEFQKLGRDLEKLKKQLSEGNKESDYKQFLLNELEELQLDDLDYDELQSQLSLQENAEIITGHLATVMSKFNLEELGVLPALNDARNRLEKITEMSPAFTEIAKRVDEAYLELKDISNEIENEAEKIEVNPEFLASLNNVNNRINALFLKHGVGTKESLVEIRERLSGEQSGFAELENYIVETERNIAEKYTELEELSDKISKNRVEASPVFKDKTEKLLRQLGLEKAQIEVQLKPNEAFNAFGRDKIGILFSANPGFPLKPIRAAISGGERSRVMLAVKKIMAENAELPTLILDEIDTGVSGKVADEMGKVMKEMSEDMQLIVITHLAQVAAKGYDNYKVVKKDIGGKTQTTILPLSRDEKLQEIAQLLSGAKITDAALQQARELMA